MEREEKTIITYKTYCPICNKQMVGYSPSQVEYNLKIHMDAKHTQEDSQNETTNIQ